ncbi:hemicentin-1-like [Xiphophorus maculatus]|uniref:hemicentin-1-like n=1 Tax=Xiphophorus maculatus TaxID=8083 RepID=UPI000C6DBDA6|nr:hemicentin-1-like [Xiphophorus maculatus]
MKGVFGLLVMLLRVSQAVETFCDGRQDGALCYGALGGSVELQLMDGASEIPRYKWRKKVSATKIYQMILTGQKNKVEKNTLSSRSVFFPNNGTFRINNLNSTDSGEYTLEFFDSNEHKNQSQTLQLFIEAPVSSVQLVSECLSQGLIRAFCLPEGGDSPQYSWTLDGHALTDSELLSRDNDTNSILLRQNIYGRLSCSVRNHISHVSRDQIVSVCKEMKTYCDGRQNGTQCYRPLGATVVLHLMDSLLEIPKYEWRRQSSTIFKGRTNTIFPHPLQSRYLLMPSNGTFTIQNLMKADSGKYTLETFNSDGQKTGQHTLQLTVQAPVSSVQLVTECLSKLELKVSCLIAEGDSPQYSWTLDGNTLTDSELISGNNETNIIVLRQNVSGRLLCSVRNHISRVSKGELIFPCKDASQLVCGLMFAAAILSCGGIGLYFKWKETKYKKMLITPQIKENPEDFQIIEQSNLADV